MLQFKTKKLYSKKKLGDLILFLRNGISNEQVDIYTDFPVTRIETIADGKIDYNRVGHVEKAPEDYRILQGDILVSNINSQKHIGKVAIKDDDKVLYHGMNLLLMRPNEIIDSKFLFYVLNFNKQYFERIASPAVNQSSINQTDMQKMEFIIPKDKVGQQKIANILSTCDEVIEKTEETIEKYKQIKAGMMQDLFTRGLDANGKLRPTYTQVPNLYKHSEELYRYIPKEWIVKPFCELYEIPSKNGLTKPSKVRGEGYKMINMGELFANKKIGNIQMELVPLSEIEKRNFEINIYDLLFARQSLVAEGAGKCSIVTNIGSYTTFESHIIRIRLDKTLYHPMYYLYLFDSNLSPTKKLIQVGAQAGIRGSELAMVNVTCPKYEEQEKIKNCLEKIDNKIDIEYKLFQKYKQIKQGLMKRLLTPPADAEIVEE